MFQIDKDSIEDFDLTYPYMIDRLVFVIPKRIILKETLMLNDDVWLTVTFSYIIISILLYYSDTNNMNLQDVFLLTYRTLLGNSTAMIPKKFFGRLIFLLWSITSWILIIDIQSYLTYFLTHERTVREINNLNELSTSNLKIGLYVHLSETFRTGSLNYEKLIYEKRVHCNINDDCLTSLLNYGNIAIVRPFKTIRYEISSKYLDNDGIPLFEIIEQTIVLRYVNICLPKYYPLYDVVNQLLENIKSSGFVRYWEKWYLNYVNILHNKHVSKSITFASKALNFRQFDGVFKLLMYGLSFGLIVFLMEFFVYKYVDGLKVFLWKLFRCVD